jgi:hypothetical protein
MAKEEPPDSVRAAVFIRGCWCRGSGTHIVRMVLAGKTCFDD